MLCPESADPIKLSLAAPAMAEQQAMPNVQESGGEISMTIDDTNKCVNSRLEHPVLGLE